MLHAIVREQETYIQDTFSFKAEIDKIFLPPNASIFTHDADKMSAYGCISWLWFRCQVGILLGMIRYLKMSK